MRRVPAAAGKPAHPMRWNRLAGWLALAGTGLLAGACQDDRLEVPPVLAVIPVDAEASPDAENVGDVPPDAAGVDAAPDIDSTDAPDSADLQANDGSDGDAAVAPCLPAACNDGDPCTKDGCSNGGCVHVPDPEACADGNACMQESCVAGQGCVFKPAGNGTPCGGSACLGGKLVPGAVCKFAACVAGVPKGCDDLEVCTDDGCAAGKCVFGPNGKPCEDGSLCTLQEACSGGACQKGPVAAVCADDGNPCTATVCQAKSGCGHVPASGACSDGSECTSGDVCAGGNCKAGEKVACSDGDKCTADACDAAKGCVFTMVTCPSDGDACTADVCQKGACGHFQGVVCQDGNACTQDFCDAVKGCEWLVVTAPCDDGSPCTFGDVCAKGGCKSGGAVDCDDGDACTLDTCVMAKGCVHAPNGLACDDGEDCTDKDVCGVGGCKGGPKNCSDGNSCSVDTCVAGKCGFAKAAEGSECGDGCGTACVAGACVVGKGALWHRVLPKEEATTIRELAPMSDGGALVLGGTNDSPASKAAITRVDALGSTVWSKPMDATWKTASRLDANQDGGCVVSGYRTGVKDYAAAARFGAEGTLQWQVAVNPPEVFKDSFAQDVAVTGDGGAAVVGTGLLVDVAWNGAQGVFLVRLAPDGKMIWHKYAKDQKGDTMYALVLSAPEGGWLVVTAHAAMKGLAYVTYQRVTASGETSWSLSGFGEGLGAVGVSAGPGQGWWVAAKSKSGGEFGDGWLRHITSDGKLGQAEVLTGEGGIEDIDSTPGGVLRVAGSTYGGSYTARLHPDGKMSNVKQILAVGGIGSPSSPRVALLTGDGAILGWYELGWDAMKPPTVWWTAHLRRIDAWGTATCTESGTCYNKPATACDDGNPCTADLCTGAKGCHTAPMPDGAACGSSKACKAGVCAPAAP